MIKLIAVILFSFSMLGCLPKNAFNPGPPAYEGWHKPNTKASEVKQAMLDCGYQNPYAPISGEAMNDKALHEICMFNKGFNRKNETGYRGVCFLKAWETIPACVEYRKDRANQR